MTSFITFFITIGTQMGSLNVTKNLYVIKLPTTRWKVATYFIISRLARHGSGCLGSSTETVRILEACHSLPEGKLLCSCEI